MKQVKENLKSPGFPWQPTCPLWLLLGEPHATWKFKGNNFWSCYKELSNKLIFKRGHWPWLLALYNKVRGLISHWTVCMPFHLLSLVVLLWKVWPTSCFEGGENQEKFKWQQKWGFQVSPGNIPRNERKGHLRCPPPTSKGMPVGQQGLALQEICRESVTHHSSSWALQGPWVTALALPIILAFPFLLFAFLSHLFFFFSLFFYSSSSLY